MPWGAPADLVTSQSLLLLFKGYLTADGATDAGSRVYVPGDWPAQTGNMPIIKLRIARESRQSQGRNSVGFTTTTTIRVMGQVEMEASEDDAGAEQAEIACSDIKRQIEVAIINAYDLYQRIQQIASIDSEYALNSEGATHIASVIMDFAVEFYEGAESFAPIASSEIDEMGFEATNYSPDAPVTATFPLNSQD